MIDTVEFAKFNRYTRTCLNVVSTFLVLSALSNLYQIRLTEFGNVGLFDILFEIDFLTLFDVFKALDLRFSSGLFVLFVFVICHFINLLYVKAILWEIEDFLPETTVHQDKFQQNKNENTYYIRTVFFKAFIKFKLTSSLVTLISGNVIIMFQQNFSRSSNFSVDYVYLTVCLLVAFLCFIPAARAIQQFSRELLLLHNDELIRANIKITNKEAIKEICRIY
ncbi:hypothetical protein D3795_04585 [Pseudidiomarina andamanensis]|uniref:Uncharacterized protein n=1 Tax=Pseudidiomarina andamanensis TaxID=1940690 RepID=A0AA92EVJ3_9GAMM|nr:hypothetical protein D3795_04585 [Pseudidiomarina andamanensis]